MPGGLGGPHALGALAFGISAVLRQRHLRRRACASAARAADAQRPAPPRHCVSPAAAALEIAREGIVAADPYRAVLNAVSREGESLRIFASRVDLAAFRRVVVVGAGKAVVPMARAVEHLLGDRIERGVVVTKHGHGERARPLSRVVIREGAHPVPNDGCVSATREIMELAHAADESTLLLVLISGGASSLLCAPAAPLSLRDLQATGEALLASGATIREMNAVRKHLEAAKGGRLALAAWPARVVTLALSDVVGDPLDVIGSGPTVGDGSSLADCRAVLTARRLAETLPLAVVKRLGGAGAGGAETPYPGDARLARSTAHVVASNALAVAAAAAAARARGLTPLVLTTSLEGEAAEVAAVVAAVAREAAATGRPVRPPCAIIAGGETTVTLPRGSVGRGGRNQELALAAAARVGGWAVPVAVASVGTDGTDGPTDAAGGVVTARTAARLGAREVDRALREHDAYRALASLGTVDVALGGGENVRVGDAGGLVRTGPTGTNVMDLVVAVVGDSGGE